MKTSTDQGKSWTMQEIISTLTQRLAALQSMGVQKIGLFGSYSTGVATPDSDMDFLVVLEKPSFDSYMDLKFYLGDLFGSKIDLVMEKNIKPRLRSHILAEVIYAA